jgi:F-type H+-transporting ATPase subunit b
MRRKTLIALSVLTGFPVWGGGFAVAAEGGMPQLDVSTFSAQIFWMGVTFAFLYLFFSLRVLPRLAGIVEGRAAQVAADLAEAQRLSTLAHETREAYEKALSQAHREAADLLVGVERALRSEATTSLSAFQGQMAQDLVIAERRITKALADARAQMDRQIAEAVVLASEKLAGVRVDRGQAQTVVDSLSLKSKAA